MCANFLSGNVSELVGYTYPKLHKGKDWYVDFYARDPVTNKMRRKKYWIASELRISEKVRRATEIINVISKQLMEGWNPWASADTYTPRVDISEDNRFENELYSLMSAQNFCTGFCIVSMAENSPVLVYNTPMPSMSSMEK